MNSKSVRIVAPIIVGLASIGAVACFDRLDSKGQKDDGDDFSVVVASTGAAEDSYNYCANFPPNGNVQDPNVNQVDCELPDGDNPVYCHLHTGGMVIGAGMGCDDLPGGGAPQLHCLSSPHHEGHHHYFGVTGNTLDCSDLDDDDLANVPMPSCDADADGILVTATFPSQDDNCFCCTIPLTGTTNPNEDCKSPSSHCGRVYYGEQCGAALPEASRKILCKGKNLPCMKKQCKWAGMQKCLNNTTGLYQDPPCP